MNGPSDIDREIRKSVRMLRGRLNKIREEKEITKEAIKRTQEMCSHETHTRWNYYDETTKMEQYCCTCNVCEKEVHGGGAFGEKSKATKVDYC